MKPKKNYKQGDVFGVPLRNGGFATGVIARKGSGSVVFGYFFGPRRETLPDVKDVQDLKYEDALYAGRFSYLGFLYGEWPIVRALPNWNAADWPFPPFVSFCYGSAEAALITYDDKSLIRPIKEERISASRSVEFYNDAVSGYVAVEIILTQMLTPSHAPNTTSVTGTPL